MTTASSLPAPPPSRKQSASSLLPSGPPPTEVPLTGGGIAKINSRPFEAGELKRLDRQEKELNQAVQAVNKGRNICTKNFITGEW